MQNFIKRTFLFTKRTVLFTKRTVLFTKRTFLFTKKTFLFTKKTFLFIYAFELKENWTKIWEWLKRKTCKKLHAKSHHDKNHLNRLSFVTCHLVCGPIDHYVCNEWLLWALLNNSNKSLKKNSIRKQIIDEENLVIEPLKSAHLGPEPESPQLVWEFLEIKESYRLSVMTYSLSIIIRNGIK